MEKSRKRQSDGTGNEGSTIREFSAGGVVYKETSNGPVFLITKSTPSKLMPNSVWRLPKGRLDDEEGDLPGPLARGDRKATSEEIEKAALSEVKEEGGVIAKIIKKIGTEKYFFTFDGVKKLKFVTFFLMKYKKDSPDGFDDETSEVGWLSFEEARKKLKYSGEKKILDEAKKTLDLNKKS